MRQNVAQILLNLGMYKNIQMQGQTSKCSPREKFAKKSQGHELAAYKVYFCH